MSKTIVNLILILSIMTFINCDFLGGKNSDSCYNAEEMNFDLCEESMLNFDSDVDREYAELTEEQKQDLIFMLQEEKVARDAYLTFSQKYNARIFKNIARSEQRHMNAVKSKLDKYKIPLNGYSDVVGEFMDIHFSQLYKSLIQTGNASLKDAINVGVQIEVLDIKDLKDRIPGAVGDVQRMFKNLLRASERHLRAFNWWAQKFD